MPFKHLTTFHFIFSFYFNDSVLRPLNKLYLEIDIMQALTGDM